MNQELIDVLAFNSGCHRHKYCNPQHPDLDGFIISHEVLDKFAELIIRECMDVVREINQEYDGGSTVVNAADEIKEHFGVQ